MQYYSATEEEQKTKEIIKLLELKHIKPERIACIKSNGTKTKRTIARIHALPKALQFGMKSEPFYVIELISEQFDRQSIEEKTKTLIHELMHIPHSFGGGFRHHKPFVNSKTVEKMHLEFQKKQSEKQTIFSSEENA